MKIALGIVALLAIGCFVLDFSSIRSARSPDEYTPVFFVACIALGVADVFAALIYAVVR